jgi:GH43 family beta-xylosidase
MCTTAALRDNASNWGEKGGCLGFFEYSFSLEATLLKHRFKKFRFKLN